MKKIALFFAAALSIVAVSCNSDDDTPEVITPVNVTLNFTHNWDGSTIENADFETTDYVNANGDELTLSKIVYLISDVTFTNSAGESYDAGDYNLVNVREESNLFFTPDIQIPPGDYTVSFTFGFDDEDNLDGEYPDLNQTSEGSWGVPAMLGGGYHYMRLEGRFLDSSSNITGFQYHAIRANDASTTPITLQDTSIETTLGQVTVGDDTTIEVKMNAAEWFKNPNQWDLNALPGMLMPNFDAQIMISENGASVFSLGSITNN